MEVGKESVEHRLWCINNYSQLQCLSLRVIRIIEAVSPISDDFRLDASDCYHDSHLSCLISLENFGI